MPPLPGGLQELGCAPGQDGLCPWAGWAELMLHCRGFLGNAEPSTQHHPASLAAFWNRLLVWKYTTERQTCTFKAKPNMSISCFLGSRSEPVPTNKLLAVPLCSALPAPACMGSAGVCDMPSVFGVLENVFPKPGHQELPRMISDMTHCLLRGVHSVLLLVPPANK